MTCSNCCGPRFVCVLDFDGVLFNQWQTQQLYPGVSNLVSKWARKYTLAIATRRSGEEMDQVHEVLKTHDLTDCFSVILGGSAPKTWHLSVIADKCKALFPSQTTVMCLLDDWTQNVEDVRSAGYNAILVPFTTGLQQQHLEEAHNVMSLTSPMNLAVVSA